MIARPFAEYLASQPLRPTHEDLPGAQPPDNAYKERAVATLLQHGVLSHAFGPHGNYEVRTTQTARQPWRYQCCVLHRGKTIKRAFAPIIIDRKRDMQGVRQARGVNEALRLKWAAEAVDVHLTRCSVLQEYLLLAAVNLQAPPQSRRYQALLALLLGVTALVAYGAWKQGVWTTNARPPENLPVATQELRDPGTDQPPTGEILDAAPPPFGGLVSDDPPAEQVREPQSTRPTEPPRSVRLSDLLAKKPSLQGGDSRSRTPSGSDPSGVAKSDLEAGDLLHLTGWIHRISRDPDSTYRLYVRSSRESGKPDIIAVVPHPDQTSESAAVRAQLQTVRTFITQRLLRRQEPSPRGSVLRRPPYLQLTGQLRSPAVPQGKGPQEVTALWEMRPVLEIQFAPLSESSGRSRPE